MNPDTNWLLSLLGVHGAELHALFVRLTLRADVAEDLLQELFLKLRRADGLARADDCKAYLFRVAMNLAFDWRRTRRRDEHLCPGPTTGAGAESPLDHLIAAEELEQVLNAVQSLSEVNRHVLVLRYLQHQEYAEIAQLLGKTEHQIRGVCSKALGQLRTLLRPAGSGPGKQGKER